MPAILGKIITWFVSVVGPIIVEKLGGAIKAVVHKIRRDKQIEDEARQSVEKLKNAKTGKEIDDAADDALNRT